MAFPQAWDGVSPSRPDPSVNAGPDDRDWATFLHEHMTLPRPLASQQDSIVPIVTTLGGLYVVRLALNGVVVNMVDAATAGTHGSVKVWDFGAGNQFVLGVDFNLVFTRGTGGLSDTAAFVMGLGTVATQTDNATLTTTEANIHPSTAGTLVAGVDTLITGNVTPKTVFGDLFLNLAAADAASTGDDTLSVNGILSFIWSPWHN